MSEFCSCRVHCKVYADVYMFWRIILHLLLSTVNQFGCNQVYEILKREILQCLEFSRSVEKVIIILKCFFPEMLHWELYALIFKMIDGYQFDLFRFVMPCRQ